MKIKHALLIFVSVFFFLNGLLAQLSNNDLVNNKEERIKIIKLEKQEFKKSLFHVRKIDVIVSTWDTTKLGYVQVGMANKKLKATFDAPFQYSLQSFIDNQYGALYNSTGKSLLWVIRDLRINERTFATIEKAFVLLKAEAYISEDNYLFRSAGSIDTVLVRSGMEVTGKHGNNIAHVLHVLYLRSADMSSGSETEQLTKEQIIERVNSRFALPILQTKSFHKGVYSTFEEFKNNAPSIDSFLVRRSGSKLIVLKWNSDGTQTPLPELWGLCSNNELYKYYRGELIPIEKEDQSFILSHYLEAINRKNKAIFWSSILGGVAGGLAESATSGGIVDSRFKVYEVTTISNIKKYRPEAAAINMETGNFSF